MPTSWSGQLEVDLLHNVPSLLDEANLERHRYFWFTERESNLDWVNATGRERARSRMNTFYAPLWREMEPVVLQLIGAAESTALPAHP